MKKKIIIAVCIILAVAIAAITFLSFRQAPIKYAPDAENGEASALGFKMGKAPKNLILPEKVYLSSGEYSLTRISINAFRNEKNLESVTLPEGMKIIDHGAFWGCTSLKALNLSKTIETIYGFAFANCTSLEQVIIPNGVITLSTGAFSGCTALKHVYLPVSISQIEDYAFHILTDADGYQPIENLVIHCKANSYAHSYALDNNIAFVLE